MKKGILTALLLLAAAAAHAQVDTVYISTLYTTHIVFATDLTYADLSNQRDIAGKIVEQNKNMLAIKARNTFSTTASVTALESNGNIHTFILANDENTKHLIVDTRTSKTPQQSSASYDSRQGSSPSGFAVSNLRAQDAPLLSDVITYKQSLFHVSKKVSNIRLTCENIFSYSDITYVVLHLKNESGVSYEAADATFIVESRNKGKRKIVYEQNLYPKNRFGTLTAPPGAETRIAYSLEKITLSDDQVLKVYLYESNGQRNLALTLSPDDVNLAKRPKN